mmetsp:Transcript_20236/g.44005  ORF Transcript_20236/g.44005 Transcript_20236/m.44005 type:complete len:101 (+) Transcript_20236:648-950(+)
MKHILLPKMWRKRKIASLHQFLGRYKQVLESRRASCSRCLTVMGPNCKGSTGLELVNDNNNTRPGAELNGLQNFTCYNCVKCMCYDCADENDDDGGPLNF